MFVPSHAVLLLVFGSLVACGGGETSSDAERQVDCFVHEAGGTYEIDQRYEIEDPVWMQDLAAECEEAGCIKRETAICLFGQLRARAGYGGGAPRAQVNRLLWEDEPAFLAWRVWSELPEEERNGPETDFVCTLNGMDGAMVMCGAMAPPVGIYPRQPAGG